MSTSPTQPTQSAKRPLEEASSPSRATDQPDAKRPALDKIIKNDDDDIELEPPTQPAGDVKEENGDDKANGEKTGETRASRRKHGVHCWALLQAGKAV